MVVEEARRPNLASRSRADFYTDTEKPKRLWVYALKTNARELLGSPGELPAAHTAGIRDGVAGARCPLKCDQLRSLHQSLRLVPDPRSRRSRRHPIGAMLGIICLGLLGGAKDVKSCWGKAGPLSQEQRRAIGLSSREKDSRRLYLPGYDAFNDLLAKIDPHQLARVLNEWLAQNEGILPRSLAIDGKSIGSLKGGIITLCHQATGGPVAMAVHQGAKEDCEMPVARELLESVQPSLVTAVVTADALHCQKPHHRGQRRRLSHSPQRQPTQAKATSPPLARGGPPRWAFRCGRTRGEVFPEGVNGRIASFERAEWQITGNAVAGEAEHPPAARLQVQAGDVVEISAALSGFGRTQKVAS